MPPLWKACFSDNTEISSDEVIYHQIKDHLDDLITLTATIGGISISLDWNLLIFKTPLTSFTHRDALHLHNIRPICVLNEKVAFTVNRGLPLTPTLDHIKIGYQGNMDDGSNVKRYIKIYPDGSYESVE